MEQVEDKLVICAICGFTREDHICHTPENVDKTYKPEYESEE